MIKIAAISDLHGNLPIMTERADILLIAGDISPLEIQNDMPKMNEWLMTTFGDWIYQLPVDCVYLVAGNHDFWFQGASGARLYLTFSTSFGGKLIYLKNRSDIYMDYNGEEWKIFGTPYCHIFGNWPFMLEDETLEKKFEIIEPDTDIIITHDPPFSFGDCDKILQPIDRIHPEHVGNKPLANKLKEINYKLCVCGHIHSGDHNFNEEHRIANVSFVDEHYKPKYEFFYKTLNK